MIVLTPLYLWLELSFGVSLLDKMGSSLPIDATAAVEHWGRLISGLALALVFLKIWFQQCEKWNRAWPVRLVVSLAIMVLSIAMMWQIQDAVIEFHVTRASSEIALALAVLAFVSWRAGCWCAPGSSAPWPTGAAACPPPWPASPSFACSARWCSPTCPRSSRWRRGTPGWRTGSRGNSASSGSVRPSSP